MDFVIAFQYDAYKVPDGYTAVPVTDQAYPLQVCALIKRKPEALGGALVLLRDRFDARIVLGCVLDAAQRVQQWIELWVQNVSGVKQTAPACREALSNAILDKRWKNLAKNLETLHHDGIIRTGWEETHPAPTLLHAEKQKPIHPLDPVTGAAWELCMDDDLLAEHGLPPYKTSLDRYLFVRDKDGKPTFSPVTTDAPTTEDTVPLDEVAETSDKLIPFNLEGGLIIVRPFYSLAYDEYLGILNGGKREGLLHGTGLLDPDETSQPLGSVDHPGRMFLAKQGQGGRLIEALHLKLCLLNDVFMQVRQTTSATQHPFLNLSSDSFRVRFNGRNPTLPFLWTSQACLCQTGVAVELPIVSTESRFYIRPPQNAQAIFWPASANFSCSGRGDMRIRQVIPEERRGTMVDGTFLAADPVTVHKNDLVWFRMHLGEQRLDLYAHMEEDRALAKDEWRFRTVGQQMDHAMLERLKAAEGVPLKNTAFEVLPLLSSPCDLYTLAVIGLKTLVVDNQITLPVALDELISLAREAGRNDFESDDLLLRIGDLFNSDERWVLSLGPQHLANAEFTPEEAFAYVPQSLWWGVLAMLIRMLPGISPFSTCQDFGDAPDNNLGRVFDSALLDIEYLATVSRSLIVTDWSFNREVHDVLDQLGDF